ncbi:hypothetical protein [Pseudoalteromonas sp. 68 DY56-GL68]|uniref:hypothetical protein n=1 Tax=Pseudoalteromonas sp. 68 DY56-GL68 TaxID=2974919 RepID=UPI00352A3100
MISPTTAIDWTIRLLEIVAVLFIVITFSKHRFALFFGGRQSIKTDEDHILHSCFISALTVMVFHAVSSPLADHIISLEMEKMMLRQFFYFTMFCFSIAFVVTLFSLHALRRCSFSPVARVCLYLAILQAIVQLTQFIMRGILDDSSLSPAYKVVVIVLNILSLAVISVYPVKKIVSHKNAEVA